MKYYPIFLDLQEKLVTIIGGGNVAERKVLTLLKAGADVTLISPEITDRIKNLVSKKKIKYFARRYKKTDCNNLYMIFIATDDKYLNAAISDQVKNSNCLINVVDSADESNFIVPSIVTKGDLQIAISTGGKSPALAKRIRKDLEGMFGDEYDLFIKLLGKVRKRLLSDEPSDSRRRRIFSNLVNSDILDLMRGGQIELAKIKIKEISGIDV